jgi:drug/metabolite transporter (DMT)-like permease
VRLAWFAVYNVALNAAEQRVVRCWSGSRRPRTPARNSSAWCSACTIGALACLPATPGLLTDLATAPAGATTGLLCLGAVPTALAFSTRADALARMDAGRLGVTTYLAPPIAIVMSAVLLGELPPWLALVGGALCLAGVALTRRR